MSTTVPNARSTAIPRVIKDGWSAHGTGSKPHLDRTKRVLYAPDFVVADAPTAQRDRDIAMLRLKYSPSRQSITHGVRPDIVEAAEVLRVRDRGARLDDLDTFYGPRRVDHITNNMTSYEIEDAVKKMSREEIVDIVLTESCTHIPWGDPRGPKPYYETGMHRVLYGDDPMIRFMSAVYVVDYDVYRPLVNFMDDVVRDYRRKPPSASVVKKAAEILSLQLFPPPPPPKDPPSTGNPSSASSESSMPTPTSQDVRKSLREARTADPKDVAERIAEFMKDALEKGGDPWKPPRTDGDGNELWLPMEIREPARELRLPGSLRTRGRAPSDSGAVMAYPSRYCVDKAVFMDKRTRKGKSAILIDASGSMRFTVKDIAELVEIAPGTIVAMYCCAQRTGRLTILAKDGRWVTQEAIARNRIGNGNGVDGPALEWLAKQHGPRYWISDGHVHGARFDHSPGTLWAACEMTCRAYNILRLNDMPTAKKFFEKKRVGGRR